MDKLRAILVVSSDPEDGNVVREIWKKEKECEILEVSNGAQAQQILDERKNIEVIYLNIIPTETTGLDFLNHVKRDGKYAHIPVVVGTQSGNDGVTEQALQLGVEDFVLKPYNREVLYHRISSVIERSLYDKDPLTKLYSAVTFNNQTKHILLQNSDIPYVILYFNIKGFTLVNDFYGSEKGEAILLEFSRILQEGVKQKGICGRVIADQFVCCIPSVRGTEEIHFYEYVQDRTEKLRKKYHFSLECGIYKVDNTDIPVSIMCDRARFSLTDIKENLGQNYAYYSAATAKRCRDEQRIIADMEQALHERQFFVMLQPIYDAATEQPISAEALVRWKHPELGIIRPDVFIPLFEKNGFIRQLDLYVWEEVCSMLARMQKKVEHVCPVSVNVSRIDLYDPGVGKAIEQLLDKYELPKDKLRLEITESAYTEKPQEIITLVTGLRQRGFELLMDDFGSGYSSLNMLKEMPIDTLKIDMQFMEELSSSPRAGNILISIVRMAKLLNISTVAEGVETREQLEFLKNVGCDRIQGYYFAKPLTMEEYEELMLKELPPVSETNKYKKGVLLVDDVKMFRRSLQDALGNSYRYFEAANGKEALKILYESVSKISMVITDIFMPEMDGFELIQELQSNSIFSHIPIIVVTSSEERKNEIRALEYGAVDVVTKPYDPVIVSQRVKNVMKLSETEWLQMEIRLMNGSKI
ncbi:EAL domain-containing protein [Lachnospiraceae bacterium JLR.KK008]